MLYAIAAAMVALVALVETSVAGERARITLEVVVVMAIFALMLRWIRANRGRIELAESTETRPPAVETALANGQPTSTHADGLRVAWRHPRLGGRRMV